MNFFNSPNIIEKIPCNQPIIVKITNINWGRSANLIISCIYKNTEIKFSVWNNDNYCTKDGKFCFKEFFKKTKKGYLKAISGKIFESKNKE